MSRSSTRCLGRATVSDEPRPEMEAEEEAKPADTTELLEECVITAAAGISELELGSDCEEEFEDEMEDGNEDGEQRLITEEVIKSKPHEVSEKNESVLWRARRKLCGVMWC